MPLMDKNISPEDFLDLVNYFKENFKKVYTDFEVEKSGNGVFYFYRNEICHVIYFFSHHRDISFYESSKIKIQNLKDCNLEPMSFEKAMEYFPEEVQLFLFFSINLWRTGE